MVCFGVYSVKKWLKQKERKNIFCIIKIIDIVLLRTVFRDIEA